MSQEIITLHTPGWVAGIPGEYAPGTYILDTEKRTLTPVVDGTVSQPEPEQRTVQKISVQFTDEIKVTPSEASQSGKEEKEQEASASTEPLQG